MNTKKQNMALIIDDTEVIRSLLSEALADRGYEVQTAPNAVTGIEMATQMRPGLVFCDTYMPDLDGFETIRRIRKFMPEAVVVMTNSLPNPDEEKPRQERQYDYLLNKPFGLEELWGVLEKIRAKFEDNQKNETK
jgi:CheY-like chemotaxis protein